MEKIPINSSCTIGKVGLSVSESRISISGPKGSMTILTDSSDVIVRKEHGDWVYYYVVDLSTPNVLTRPFPATVGNYEKKSFDHDKDIVIEYEEKDGSCGALLVDRGNPHVLTRACPVMDEDDIEHVDEIAEKENIMRAYIKKMDEEAIPYGCPADY